MSKWLSIVEIVESVSITHKFDKPKLKFLNTADVEKGKIVNYTELPISELKGQAKKTIQKDDILFSEVRPKNKHYAYVDIEDCSDYVVSTKLMVLRKFNKDVDNKYFYYSLINDKMLDILQSRAENRICSFPQITFDLLSEYKIRMPEISEQKNIAHILEIIDKKIELNNKINSELENFAKTLYDYWFVQFDFPDENERPYKSSGGEMVYNEILKRCIPVNWSIKEFQHIASISNEQITPDEEIVYKHYSIPAFDERGTYILDSGANIHSNKFIIKSFDVLISKLNPKFSRVICADNEDNMVSSTELIVFRCNDKKNQSLVYCIAKSDNFYSYCVKNATGSSGSHNRINPEIMGTYRIPYNHSIYELFKSRISNIIQKRNLIIKENQKLICIRDFLLPMLMNGQISIIAE